MMSAMGAGAGRTNPNADANAVLAWSSWEGIINRRMKKQRNVPALVRKEPCKTFRSGNVWRNATKNLWNRLSPRYVRHLAIST